MSAIIELQNTKKNQYHSKYRPFISVSCVSGFNMTRIDWHGCIQNKRDSILFKIMATHFVRIAVAINIVVEIVSSAKQNVLNEICDLFISFFFAILNFQQFCVADM